MATIRLLLLLALALGAPGGAAGARPLAGGRRRLRSNATAGGLRVTSLSPSLAALAAAAAPPAAVAASTYPLTSCYMNLIVNGGTWLRASGAGLVAAPPDTHTHTHTHTHAPHRHTRFHSGFEQGFLLPAQSGSLTGSEQTYYVQPVANGPYYLNTEYVNTSKIKGWQTNATDYYSQSFFNHFYHNGDNAVDRKGLNAAQAAANASYGPYTFYSILELARGRAGGREGGRLGRALV